MATINALHRARGRLSYLRLLVGGICALLVSVSVLSSGTKAQAVEALVVPNGGFEEPSATSNDVTYQAPSALGAWNLVSGSIDLLTSGYWQPSEGSQSVDLNGGSPGRIEQTVAVQPGTAYTLSFDFSGNPDGGPSQKAFHVEANGVNVGSSSFDVATNSHSAMGWKRGSVQIGPFTSSSFVLAFASDTEGAYGPALDNIGIARPQSAKYEYVALGDSFASGEGAHTSLFQADTRFPDPATGGSTGCHRSTQGWAPQLAASRGYRADEWHFVACSGARFIDLYDDNISYVKYGAQPEEPQLSFLNPRTTKLATMTMGGNDVGFADIFKACVYDTAQQNGSSNCRKKSGTTYLNARTNMENLRSGSVVGSKSLADVYTEIGLLMVPRSTIVVAGYPRFFSGSRRHYLGNGSGISGACRVGTAAFADQLFVSFGDAKWINDLAAEGNQIISDQVRIANGNLAPLGTRIIVAKDLDKRFNKHRLCDAKDSKDSYFNGAIFHGKHRSPDRRSFHPNQDGQNAYYEAIQEALRKGR